jgi:hypothetical protein
MRFAQPVLVARIGDRKTSAVFFGSFRFSHPSLCVPYLLSDIGAYRLTVAVVLGAGVFACTAKAHLLFANLRHGYP